MTDLEARLPESILRWYDFEENAKILFVSGGFEECEVLKNLDKEVDVISVHDLTDITSFYDYIMTAGVIEKAVDPVEVLTELRKHLTLDGRLLVVARNRLAIKYFCGEKDYFTNKVFDGIDHYQGYGLTSIQNIGGRLYSQAELSDFIRAAGFSGFHFLGVYPSVSRPQILFSEGYHPNENLDIRIMSQYRHPDTVFLDERRLYDTLAQNELLVKLANGYVIEVGDNLKTLEIQQITISSDRGEEKSLATLIRKDNTVEKKALYSEGKLRIKNMMNHFDYLMDRGVPMIEGKLLGDSFVMPFLRGETALVHFRKVLCEDKDLFLKEFDELWNTILKSAEHVDYQDIEWEKFEPGWEKRKEDDPYQDKWRKLAFGTPEERAGIGPILKRGYVDLIALNAMWQDGRAVFFDQEEYVSNFPAKAIMLRNVQILYSCLLNVQPTVQLNELMERYGLSMYEACWRKKTELFLKSLRNDDILAVYNVSHRPVYKTMRSNRVRMNYPDEAYNRYFKDIFKNAYDRKIYLFGSGQYTKKFLEKYKSDFQIVGILDNNQDKWGTTLEGIKILAPSVLREEQELFKVFICIRDCHEVLDQLLEMKIQEIGIFNPNVENEFKREIHISKEEDSQPKKYEVGYIAGVFDLFHIGHLNLLKRAKEQCKYLIVGVVTDEQVMRNKKTMPMIPFTQRIEIVRACKYVDEAVEIPLDHQGTIYAYDTYHFDVQFSGSDYVNDPSWLSNKAYLNQRGADIIFFPYTEGVSSTKLKNECKKVIAED